MVLKGCRSPEVLGRLVNSCPQPSSPRSNELDPSTVASGLIRPSESPSLGEARECGHICPQRPHSPWGGVTTPPPPPPRPSPPRPPPPPPPPPPPVALLPPRPRPFLGSQATGGRHCSTGRPAWTTAPGALLLGEASPPLGSSCFLPLKELSQEFPL